MPPVKKSVAEPKRVIPASAPFRLLDASELVDPIIFESGSKRRKSLYLGALQSLLAKPGQLMEVDSLTARGAILAQAKKHGITVLFAEKTGKLYVKVLGKQSAEECVLKALQPGPLTLVEIETELVKAHSATDVNELVKTLSESHKIALRTVAGTNVRKWFFVAH